MTLEAKPPPELINGTQEYVMTRAERAHWQITWQERLLRNARPEVEERLILTLHGLSTSFAHLYGFPLYKEA
ncbi:hypothetical protein KSC_026500 [Ktedonobacter sp. SOSP1-52]|nr:hypothetical protein KSC_026500 [Ktedonobacter sp. SOSP1-52]